MTNFLGRHDLIGILHVSRITYILYELISVNNRSVVEHSNSDYLKRNRNFPTIKFDSVDWILL